MGYPFEEELKEELVTLGRIKEDLDDKKKEYENCRNKVQKWLEANELSSFDVEDSNGTEWGIKFEPRRNRRIKDWKLIEAALGENFEDLVNIFESSVFKVGRKAKKKKS
jgi:hypothetical protein